MEKDSDWSIIEKKWKNWMDKRRKGRKKKIEGKI